MSLVTSVRPPWATQIFAVPKMARDLNCKVKWPRTIWENNLFLQRFRFEVSDGVLYGFAATAKSATAAQRARGGPTWLSRTAFQSSIWSRASEGWSHWCGEIAMGHIAGHRIWNPPFRVRICMCTLYDMRVYIYIYITIIIYWYIYIYVHVWIWVLHLPTIHILVKARAHAWHPSGSRCGPGNIGISVNHPRRMWSICGFYLLYPIWHNTLSKLRTVDGWKWA